MALAFLAWALALVPVWKGQVTCFGYASTSWTNEFQKMSPPMAFSPRLVVTDRTVSAQE